MVLASRLVLLACLLIGTQVVVGCGSKDPDPNVGEVTTSPKGLEEMKKSGGKPKPSGMSPSFDN